MFKKIALLLSVFAMVQCAAFAAVKIEKRTGTIRITNPGAEPVEVKAGAPLPEIADGAVVEIVDGTALVAATENSVLKVMVSGTAYTVVKGSGLSVLFDVKGIAHVTVIKDQPVVEGYVPPAIDDPVMNELKIGDEESTRDISPISQ